MSHLPSLSGPISVHKHLNINPSFEEKHPKISDALIITSIVIAILTFLVLISFACVAAPGLTIPIFAGVVLGTFTLFSVVFATMMIKSRRKLENFNLNFQKPAIRYALGDASAAWESYEEVVNNFAALNLHLHKQEQSILRHAEDGEEFLKLASEITENYQKSLELLKNRPSAYKQVSASPHDNSLFVKNREIMSLCQHMISNLSQYGGIFSLKTRGLASSATKISRVCNLVVLLAGLAGVGAVIALVPWSLTTLPIFIVTVLGAGVCILGISYILRFVLQRSSLNQRELFQQLAATVDLPKLKEMTRLQHQLFMFLQRSLYAEELAIQKEVQSKAKVSQLKDEIQKFVDQLAELRFAHKYLESQMRAREQSLMHQVVSFESHPVIDSDDEEFADILHAGAKAAQRRRSEANRLSVSQYEEYLSSEELEFGTAWEAKASRFLEGIKISDQQLSPEDRLLIERGISKTLKKSQKRLHRIEKLIKSNQSLLSKLVDDHEESQQILVSEVADVYQSLFSEGVEMMNQLSDLFQLLTNLVDNPEDTHDESVNEGE